MVNTGSTICSPLSSLSTGEGQDQNLPERASQCHGRHGKYSCSRQFAIGRQNTQLNHLGEEFFLAHSFRVQSVMAGKSWRQEHEADAPTEHTIRKQRDECQHAACLLLIIQRSQLVKCFSQNSDFLCEVFLETLTDRCRSVSPRLF